MSFTRHDLNIYPIPKEKSPMFINEPWLSDLSLLNEEIVSKEPEREEDNTRVYIPTDINRKSMLRRINAIIMKYGEATEENEMFFSQEVEQIISQLEIYDQIWRCRDFKYEAKHSEKAVKVAADIINLLEDIPDGGAEGFPFEIIEDLREEYLSER